MKIKNKLIIGSSLALVAGKVLNKLLYPQKNHISPNTRTTFNIGIDSPTVNPTAFVHPMASIIGQVHIGKEVFVAPFASIRGDEGLRIDIGDHCNVQDGVVLHGIKNFEYGSNIVQNCVFAENDTFSIYIGERVSLAHQCQVHGPCRIDSNVFIGMQCLVFDSYVQEGVILEPGSKVIGVTISKNRYVSAGQVITNQEEADRLPEITPGYRYYDFNRKMIGVNKELTKGYRRDE
jgi:carbonic anhydrase/acetyltransferase-like protein (isoleucine patch superfamily)